MKRPALTILCTIAIGLHLLCAQTQVASKEFDYNKSFVIHEIKLTRGTFAGNILMLKENKKSSLNLVKLDENLNELWNTPILLENQDNVPQLFINDSLAMTFSYLVDDKADVCRVHLKTIDLSSGTIVHDLNQQFINFSKKSPHPRFCLSPDLSKLVLYNYISEVDNQPQFSLFQLPSGNLLKSFNLDPSFFGESKYNKFKVDNLGNVFYTHINTTFFRLDGHYLPFTELNETKVFEHDMLFIRPMDIVSDIKIIQSGDQAYTVTATGKIKNDLIGVKMVEFDFDTQTIQFDTTRNFNIQYFYYLYQEALKASPYVKKSSLKEPWRLKNYRLQEVYTNSNDDLILLLEKNLRDSDYHYRFNSDNLPFLYNTKRKLQKSEDIIIMAFSDDGTFLWDHVIQKYQVTRPFSFYLSYVSGMFDDQLNILNWTKKSKHNFHVTTINTLDGKVVHNQLDILPGEKYTYNKNYTTWIDKNTLFITTQEGNKKNKREMKIINLE